VQQSEMTTKNGDSWLGDKVLPTLSVSSVFSLLPPAPEAAFPYNARFGRNMMKYMLQEGFDTVLEL
jgi:hypothetical protein